MQTATSTYLSYLLRVWRDVGDGEWHATLQDVASGECHHFATLDELYVNLQLFTSERNHRRMNSFELFDAPLPE